MKCSLLTLSCALDGELSRERQAELDAHLITCERCRNGMRYLREETERIAVLAPVALERETATALLERSRVLIASGPPPVASPAPADPVDQVRMAPDPFGTMGLDTAIMGTTEAPEDEAEPESDQAAGGPALEYGSSFEAEAADGALTEGLGEETEELWPAEAAQAPSPAESEMAHEDPEISPGADWEGISETPAQTLSETGGNPTQGPTPEIEPQLSYPPPAVSREEPWMAPPAVPTPPLAGPALTSPPGPGLDSYPPVVPELGEPEAAPEPTGSEAPQGVGGGVAPSTPAELWLAPPDLDPEPLDDQASAVIGPAPGPDGPPAPPGGAGWRDPGPPEPVADEASRGVGGGVAPSTPEELWLASPDTDPEPFADQAGAATGSAPGPDGPPAPSGGVGWRVTGPPEPGPDHVHQFGIDDDFLVGGDELETLDSASPTVEASREQATEEHRPSTVVVPGWEPATSLEVPWAEIPPAEPAENTWAPDLAGVPVRRTSAGTGPVHRLEPTSAPTRPAAAAIPGLQADEASPGLPPGGPRRTPEGGHRRPARPPAHRPGSEPRGWTRTGLIAVAAVAIVLIGWNLLHASGNAAVAHHPKSQATPTTQAKTTPQATPSSAPTPITLAGVQSVGGTGSGYQVQTVRYGVHGAQYWVVFQFIDGSGTPKITAGFDGPTTLYLEMQGVAAGTPVPQPGAGAVVSSITVGKVPGFSGAVYILHLTRSVQLSPSMLAGTDTGGAGERYLAILQ